MSIYSSDVASTPLYADASLTVLQGVHRYFEWFTDHPSMSKSALSDISRFNHHEVLPGGNELPDSYEGARKVVEPFLIKPIIFHAGPKFNDCVIFRGSCVDAEQCPECGSDRYLQNRVPAKSFSYLPIGPRLVRLMCNSHLHGNVPMLGVDFSLVMQEASVLLCVLME